MKQEWLIKERKSKCILFFNGWGMDSNAVKDLKSYQYDVYACSHYDSHNELQATFEEYEEINLIAWSLGVFVANKVVSDSELSLKHAVAINGTCSPCHDEQGIPAQIFSTTLSTWNEANRKKFMMRMLGGRQAFADNQQVLPNRSIEDQIGSLQVIYEQTLSKDSLSNSMGWTMAVCGAKDLIFGVENQKKAWGDRGKVFENIPHFPFFEFSSWDQLILLCENA